MSEADSLLSFLKLQPHPEGGHYRETYRDMPAGGGRGSVSLILFLLKAGELSHWHRIDATEIWHWHAGSPLVLGISPDGQGHEQRLLGADVHGGQSPQIVVPPKCWQSARSTGAWTLVGCTVSPAFEFAGFELAPPGWSPG